MSGIQYCTLQVKRYAWESTDNTDVAIPVICCAYYRHSKNALQFPPDLAVLFPCRFLGSAPTQKEAHLLFSITIPLVALGSFYTSAEKGLAVLGMCGGLHSWPTTCLPAQYYPNIKGHSTMMSAIQNLIKKPEPEEETLRTALIVKTILACVTCV